MACTKDRKLSVKCITDNMSLATANRGNVQEFNVFIREKGKPSTEL